MDTRTTWIRQAVTSHIHSWRLRIWLILLCAAAGAMAFLPLFSLLGFGFCFVMAMVASLASLDLGSALVRRLKQLHLPAEDTPPQRALARTVAGAAVVNLGLLVPPLLIICANGLRVRNCDWLFGFKAYVLLPGLSVVVASALGVICGVVSGRRRWLSNLLPYALFAVSVGYSVWRFYAAPPVFSYNMFAGYFPGNLYDETVDLRAPFYWARLYQLTLVSALLCLTALWLDVSTMSLRRLPRLGRSHLKVAAAAMVLSLVTGWMHLASGRLGFDIDGADIQRHLGGRYDTEHFTIYYPPGGDIERDIHIIAEDHEFRYAQVARLLGAELEGRVTSYYFASAQDKYRMMGAGRVYMAKPWRNEIYLQHQAFPHQVLRHEVAHVIAGVFGAPVFRVSADTWLGLPVVFNPGLIEGTAVAADWPDHFDRPLTPHQSVKAMLEMGMAPPAHRVLSTGFLAFSSARSYTLAGSFVRYLLDTYGADRLRALYRTGGDFPGVYGHSQSELLEEWGAMIAEVELPPRAAEVVRERFRRPGIFGRPCPHAIARQRTAIAEHLARGDVAGAIWRARKVCALVPGEPLHRLELAGLLVRAGESADAIEIYQDIAGNSEHISSTLRAQALWEMAAMAARDRDWIRAEELLTEAAALPLRARDLRFSQAELFAITHAGPATPLLRDYFWGSDSRWGIHPMVQVGRAAAIVAAEPELGLGHYLLGRNLMGQGAPGDVARVLAASLDLGLPGPLFVREAARLLAESAYQAGDDALVERAAAILLRPEQPSVVQLYGADWLERLHWKRTGTLPSLQ